MKEIEEKLKLKKKKKELDFKKQTKCCDVENTFCDVFSERIFQLNSRVCCLYIYIKYVNKEDFFSLHFCLVFCCCCCCILLK